MDAVGPSNGGKMKAAVPLLFSRIGVIAGGILYLTLLRLIPDCALYAVIFRNWLLYCIISLKKLYISSNFQKKNGILLDVSYRKITKMLENTSRQYNMGENKTNKFCSLVCIPLFFCSQISVFQ